MIKMVKYLSGATDIRKAGLEIIKSGEIKNATIEEWHEVCDLFDSVMTVAFNRGMKMAALFSVEFAIGAVGYLLIKKHRDKKKEESGKESEEEA